MTYRAVLFDLDETLFNRTASLNAFLTDQISRHDCLRFDEPEKVISNFLVLDDRGKTPKDEVYQALLQNSVSEVSGLASELFREYETGFWRFAKPFTEMDVMFADLKQLGAKTGIVTNGQTHLQLRTLLALNLDRIVDDYLISEVIGIRKPQPEVFELAASRLSVEPSECIFVGDTARADVLGAKQSGMKGVWFPNGAVWDVGNSETPDATISSLKEVTRLYREWNQA